jgi:hypothetical protein
LRYTQKDIDREIKRSLKKYREEYWSNLAKQMEDANRSGNTRKLYHILRKCAGTENATAVDSIEKADGTAVSNVDEQMKWWAGQDIQLFQRISDDLHTPVDCSTEAPSIFEIQSTIKSLKNNKAAGKIVFPQSSTK